MAAVLLQNLSTRIRESIDRMADAIDQAAAISCLPVQDLFQCFFDTGIAGWIYICGQQLIQLLHDS